MMDDARARADTPYHIEETVRLLAQLHADHHESATPHERVVERAIGILARPWMLAGLTGIIAAWVATNMAAPMLHYTAFDPPPFVWLEGAVSLASLYMVMLVLAAQRHEDRLTQRREQLTLELAMLSEQKSAKIIQLIEEHRRDNPQMPDRHDAQAAAMSRPSDTGTVLGAVEQTESEAGRETIRRQRAEQTISE